MITKKNQHFLEKYVTKLKILTIYNENNKSIIQNYMTHEVSGWFLQFSNKKPYLKQDSDPTIRTITILKNAKNNMSAVNKNYISATK